MKHLCLFAALLFMPGVLFAAMPAAVARAPREWDVLEKQIAADSIQKYAARDRLKELRPLLDAYFAASGGVGFARAQWVFPVEGYGYRAADRFYVARRFDFLSSVRHKDHPACDIFIRDKNRDSIDDRTGRPVNILSMTSGVVVGRNAGWTPESPNRGGNCVWVYDTVSKGLVYYAHFTEVSAAIGDIVRPGTILGTMGRTGINAVKKRSPTHLHIMYLSWPDTGYPFPRRVYNYLIHTKLTTIEGSEAK